MDQNPWAKALRVLRISGCDICQETALHLLRASGARVCRGEDCDSGAAVCATAMACIRQFLPFLLKAALSVTCEPLRCKQALQVLQVAACLCNRCRKVGA